MPPFLELLAPLAAWALTTHLCGTDSSPQFTPEETEAWRGGGVPLGSEGTAVAGHGPELSSRLPLRVLQNVGCDFEIDSGATEDRCGVCQGNGSTCHTVSGTFQEAEGLGMGGTSGGRQGGPSSSPPSPCPWRSVVLVQTPSQMLNPAEPSGKGLHCAMPRLPHR